MFKKLMTQLMLSCQKATGLIEKKLNFALGKRERLQLFLHKSMCQACSNYEKQSLLLDKSLKQQARFIGEVRSKELRLSDNFKKKLLEKLETK
jgi:hypothetical protein